MDSRRLVGRDAELALLRQEVERARAGEARTVVVQGEAGIGKTALVAALTADLDGVRVVRASGEESEHDLPFGVLDQVLDALLDEPAPRPPLTPPAAGAVLLRALSDAQVGEPVLLWVDDLQWCDTASQQAVVFGLRRLAADNVCVVLSLRGADRGALTPGARRLLAQPDVTVLHLAGLDDTAVTELAREVAVGVTPAAARRLRRHTGGNPLWTRVLLQELDERALGDPRASLPAPRMFADVVRHRFALLSEPARTLVEVACVAATDWPLAVLAAVAGTEDAHAALTEAVAAELLTESGTGPTRVRPQHALVAAAVVSGLPSGRRADLHHHLAAVATSEHEQLHHLVAATAGPDEALADRLEEVGHDQLVTGAWLTASRTLTSSAHLRTEPARRAALLEEATELTLLAGDVSNGAALATELEDWPGRPRSLVIRAWLALMQARHTEAEQLLALALKDAPPEDEARACLVLAQLYVFSCRAGLAVEPARRAGELAPDLGPVAAQARAMLATARATSGDVLGALADLDALRLDPSDPAAFPELVAHGSVLVMAAEFGRATDLLEAAAAATDRIGLFQFSSVLRGQATRARFILGDWASAVDNGHRSVDAVDAAELAWPRAVSHSLVAQVHARMGSWALAEMHADVAGRHAAATGDHMSTAYAQVAEAALAHSRGDARDVLRATDVLVDLQPRDGVDLMGILDWDVLRCEALVAVGRVDEAADRMDALASHAAYLARPFPLAEVARLDGLLARAVGDTDLALTRFAAARDLAGREPAPFERAQAEYEMGRTHAAAGRPDDARRLLRAALTTFEELGAAPFAERTAAELGRVGAADDARRSVSKRVALTPQEIAVTRLVRQGLSNREVATELFLSTKTVEFHLRHVFMKLGVSSRAQLIARSPVLLDVVSDEGEPDLGTGTAEDA